MSRKMIKKGIFLFFVVSMILAAVACKKESGVAEDYRQFVYKESSSFEVSENKYGYLVGMMPCGEQIAAIFTETIYPEATEGEEPVYDGTMEDDMGVWLPDAKGTPAANATEDSTEAETENETESEIESDTVTDELFYPEYSEDYMSDFYNIVHVLIYNQDGTIAQQVDFELASGESTFQVWPDLVNSVIYTVINDLESNWIIKKFDMNGTEEDSVKMTIMDSEYAYVQKLLLSADGKIVVGMENSVQVFDTDLNFLGEIKSETYLYSFFASPNGTVFTSTDKELPNGEYAQVVLAMDLNTFEFGQEYELKSSMDYMQFSNGAGSYDASILGTSGMYAWKAGDTAPVKLMGFIESDINSELLTDAFLLDDKTVVFNKRNAETWSLEGVVICKKADPSEIAEKETITLGMLYYDTMLASEIIDFNAKSETVRIQVKNYRDDNGDWETAQKAFNNDLISGNCPDIIFMTETTEQFYNYMEKGTFASLDSFIKEDEEIDENDIFPNVKAALSSNDEMYAITPSFYVMSMAMKEKYAPERGRINFDEVIALEQQLGAQAFHGTVSEVVLNNLLTFGYDEYIDIRTGKCNFSDSFAKALEYAAQYPTEIDYDEDLYANYDTLYREDKALLSYAFISDFREFNRMEQGTFGEKVELVGFPGEEGQGAVLCLGQIYAISSKSKNKEAAWEFIRTFMTKEYQEAMDYNFPTRLSSTNEMLEEQMQKEFYIDEDGTKYEYDDTYYINGEEVVIPPISKERAEYVLEYISGVETVTFVNDQISSIISEEAAPFFAGQKNSKQVVEIIQSRVQTYVNESR